MVSHRREDSLIFDRTNDARVHTDGKKLNVRSRPDKNSQVIDSLTDGTIVPVESIPGSEWTKVLVNRKTGYCMSKYLVNASKKREVT